MPASLPLRRLPPIPRLKCVFSSVESLKSVSSVDASGEGRASPAVALFEYLFKHITQFIDALAPLVGTPTHADLPPTSCRYSRRFIVGKTTGEIGDQHTKCKHSYDRKPTGSPSLRVVDAYLLQIADLLGVLVHRQSDRVDAVVTVLVLPNLDQVDQGVILGYDRPITVFAGCLNVHDCLLLVLLLADDGTSI